MSWLELYLTPKRCHEGYDLKRKTEQAHYQTLFRKGPRARRSSLTENGNKGGFYGSNKLCEPENELLGSC